MLECSNARMLAFRWLMVTALPVLVNHAGMRTKDLDIIERTARFAVRVIRMVDVLPQRTSSREVGRQVVRSAASVGAHCREARRARTAAEFASKIQVAQQECEETAYWLLLIAESSMLPETRLAGLRDEADQLMAMLLAATRTAHRRGQGQ